MLFLESPSGVGFSYCEHEEDCWFTDEKTASDNYDAIAAFFAAYPEFATQDFYITGESYAGATPRGSTFAAVPCTPRTWLGCR